MAKRTQRFTREVEAEIRHDIDEHSVLLAGIFKWVAMAAIVGVVVGALTALFLKSLNAAIGFTSSYWWFFLLLPVALVINVLFIKYVFPDAGPPSTDAVIKDVHERKSVPLGVAVKAFFAPILTIASGGSVGKEAPAADMGAATGTLLGRIFRFSKDDLRKLAICGISAGFAAVFGTPIAGAIFGIEILFVGSMLYEVILPSFVAGIVSYYVAAALGTPFWYHAIHVVPEFTGTFFLAVVLAGVFFGLCAFLLIQAIRWARRVASASGWKAPAIALVGGIILVLLALVFSTQYFGLGVPTIESTVQGNAPAPFAFLLKILFTALTLASGGSGGLVTPTLFIGSTAGAAFAQVLHLDIATFAAIGTVAVLAGATNAPIAASVLAIELFGPAIAPFAALACIISFVMTGSKSIYPSQVFKIRKSGTRPGERLRKRSRT
jgi:H+/Cl- antiporter ClcA